MDEGTSELLSMLGTMQTLVDNFPMGLLSQVQIKNYTSVFDFLTDCFQAINVSEKDIFRFILTDIIGVNFSMDGNDFGKLNKWMQNLQDEDLADCEFLNQLESIVKSLISLLLAEVYSCSIHPKVKQEFIESGVVCPINAVDLSNMLDICPTSDEGMRIYNDITKEDTPSGLNEAKDLNAFLWYVLYKANGNEVKWVDRRKNINKEICSVQNQNTNYLNFLLKIDDDYSGKSLYSFNKDYLDSIKIFSAKGLITGLFESLVLGLPTANIHFSYGYNDILTEAMLNKIVKNTITIDDTEINDCFYTFTNDDWLQMMEENELKKYNARYAETQDGVGVEVNKQAVIDGINEASSAATLYEKREIIEKTVYDVSVTPTTDSMSETTSDIQIAFNANWLSNIIVDLINPIIKSLLSPKVMLLVIANYEIAGLVDTTNLQFDMFSFLEFIKKKLIGFIVRLVVKIKDVIVKALMKFFKEKIMPLILKWAEKRILEQIEGYLATLVEALECVKIFGGGFGNVLTSIDDVNYADIVLTEKVVPDSNNPC